MSTSIGSISLHKQLINEQWLPPRYNLLVITPTMDLTGLN